MDGLTLFVGLSGAAGAIVGAFIGAKIGGTAVKESVLLAAEKAREAEQERERQEIANLRKALLVEIETTKDRYMDGIGHVLESHPHNTPFAYIYPAFQRYFVIFEENAHLVGKLPDDRERHLLVQTYTMAKGLLDSYKFNNSMAEKQGYARALEHVVPGDRTKPILQEIEQIMAWYAPSLKKMHQDTLALFEELRASLQKPLS